jgi:hypothetical protein
VHRDKNFFAVFTRTVGSVGVLMWIVGLDEFSGHPVGCVYTNACHFSSANGIPHYFGTYGRVSNGYK